MSQDQATSTLAGMGLGAQIQYQSSDYVAVGCVIGWAPTSADGSLHAGDTVIIYISTGPTQTAPSADPTPSSDSAPSSDAASSSDTSQNTDSGSETSDTGVAQQAETQSQ